MKEQAIFTQLAGLIEAALLSMENGKQDAGMAVLYTAQDLLKEVLDYYPSKKSTEV